MTNLKRIGVLTSGGDAPGMNAAIRAVIRSAHNHDIESYGIYHGYQGMINGNIKRLDTKDVSGIIQRGGTIIKTARCEEFKTKEGREKAAQNLRNNNIDGVVVIGGDGSFKGANAMSEEFNIPFIGIPGTIDNDIYGTDYTIGYDTALNTVINAVDNIRDTASSHDRVFFIEVMGKEAGFVALRSGIACGCEGILIPEIEHQHKQILRFLRENKGKRQSSIFMVAEGDEEGHAIDLANKVKNEFPELDVRTSILGHIQRGGSPSCMDRVTASRMGVAAVEALRQNKSSIMIGLVNNQINEMHISQSVKMHKSVNQELYNLVYMLI